MTVRLVILDRDGVINVESDQFVKSAEEWTPIEGSMQGIRELTEAGFTVTVASNQSGLGRGLFDRNALDKMHEKMLRLVAAAGGKIDHIVVCPHRPDEDCSCRKPKPGLLLQLAEYYETPLSGVPVIGDSVRDIKAALAAGARPILVLTGNGARTKQEVENWEIDIAPNLLGAARLLTGEMT